MTGQNHWIFLRGLVREQQHWGNFVEKLSKQLQWPNCHVLDLPGCGKLWQQPSPYSIAKIRYQLQQQIETLDIALPYGVIALSLGAMVALDWLNTTPDSISHIVIINSSISNCPLHWRLRTSALYHLLRAALTNDNLQHESHILRLVSNRHHNNTQLLNQWCEIRRQHPVTRANALRQLVAAARFRLNYIQPGKKGLILSSLSDSMVSYRCSKKIAAITGWPLCIHSNAGHDIPLDDPEWVINTIQEWI